MSGSAQLLATGWVPLAWLIGARWFQGPNSDPDDDPVARIALPLVTGIAVLTPILILLANLGWLRYDAVGAVGWAAAAIAVVRRRSRLPDHRSVVTALALATFVATFVVVSSHFVDPPWGAGRDQQVYAQSAAGLAQRGEIVAHVVGLDDADRALLAELDDSRRVRAYSGLTREGTGDETAFRGTLPLGWIVWLGAWYAVFGLAASITSASAFFALGAILVYVLGRPLVGAPLAAASTIALAVLPSSLWIAGTTLSESLAMALLLTALALATRERTSFVAFAVVLVAAAIVRIDSLVLVPAMLASLLAAPRPDDESDRALRRQTFTLLGALAVACLWYAVLNRIYLISKLPQVGPLATVSVILSLPLVALRETSLAKLRAFAARGRAGLLIAITLVALFAWAAWFRPDATPPSLIANGGPLHGTRDYREWSLINLAAYTGWPLLVLALAGAGLAWTRAFRGAQARNVTLVVACATFVALLYLWYPHVTPTHPWAIRRFVPVVIPFALLCAALALHAVTAKVPRWRFASALLLPALAAFALLQHGLSGLRLPEQSPTVQEALATFARELPDELVLADLSAGPSPAILLVVHGKPVLFADFADPTTRAVLQRWAQAKSRAGRTAWLLQPDDSPRAGLDLQPIARLESAVPRTTPVTRAPARETSTVPLRLVLGRALPPPEAAIGRRFGHRPTPGIAETGFHASEVTLFGDLRQTTGEATLMLPSTILGPDRELVIDFLAWSPTGRHRAVAIAFNGREAWRGDVSPGPSTVRVAMPYPVSTDGTRVEIHSDTFDSRSVNPQDTRGPIGIGIAGLRVESRSRAPDAAALGLDATLWRDATQERFPLRPGGTHIATISITHRGTGGPWAGETAPWIVTRWTPEGEPARVVARSSTRLPVALPAQDTLRTQLRLVAADAKGAPLPPGRYAVEVTLANVPDDWPGDASARTLRFAAQVAP